VICIIYSVDVAHSPWIFQFKFLSLRRWHHLAYSDKQERVKTKPSYDQAEKLPRECQRNDSQEKHQPGINTQEIVKSYVMLWISVEVTTAEQVDQVAQHPQQRRQPA